jgi:hypothetical protein
MIARILTILRKDVRRLWPYVVAFWCVMVAAGMVAGLTKRAEFHDRELLEAMPVLEWIACVLLIVSLIHQERLMDHEQYWLARPIRWPELVMAKATFVAALVNLPVWICRHYIFGPYWFPYQIQLTAYLILPTVAFAAVTRHLGQPILLFAGVIIAWETVSPSVMIAAPMLPALAASIAAISLGAILIQYATRRDLFARAILLAGVVGVAVWGRL